MLNLYAYQIGMIFVGVSWSDTLLLVLQVKVSSAVCGRLQLRWICDHSLRFLC